MPRVRFLVHGAERTGPPIYMLRLARQWSSRPPGFRSEIVLARPGALAGELGAVASTRVARLDGGSPERRGERLAAAVGAAGAGRWLLEAAVRARVRGDDPDLTVVNGATAPTVELLRALRPHGRVVTIAHELSTGWFANLTADDRELLLTRTAAYLAVSESVRGFLIDQLGVPSGAITVVPPPVDLAELGHGRRTARHTGAPLVVGSGVTDWRKSPESWLRVAAAVRRTSGHEDVRFVWVGGDTSGSPAFWPVEHEMRLLELDERVTFLGTVPEPWRALDGASVMVSTARQDAYPLACAESIANGVPVVGFDLDGVGEMVRSSGCGIVVPYADEAAMARAVTQLLDDPARRDDMSERGRDFARRELDATHVAARVAAWIEEQAA